MQWGFVRMCLHKLDKPIVKTDVATRFWKIIDDVNRIKNTKSSYRFSDVTTLRDLVDSGRSSTSDFLAISSCWCIICFFNSASARSARHSSWSAKFPSAEIFTLDGGITGWRGWTRELFRDLTGDVRRAYGQIKHILNVVIIGTT